MRHILLHHHIFKNAGTTLDFALWRNFDERYVAFHPNDSDSDGIVYGAQIRDFLRVHPETVGLTSHHFHLQQFRENEGREFAAEFRFYSLALFRHPIDRIISMYDFYRSGGAGDAEQAALVERLTVGDWVEWMMDNKPHLVNDVQVGLLSRNGHYVGPPAASDLQRAKERLEHLALTGQTERFDDVCIAGEFYLQSTFGKLDLAYVSENVSRVRTGGKSRIDRLASLGVKVFDRLRRFNALDLELWEFAGIELDRRLALLDDLGARRSEFAERKTRLEKFVKITRAEEEAAKKNGTLAGIDYDRLRAPAYLEKNGVKSLT
jgi:hypothetical protein